jgi:hypothetical protein
MKYVMLEMVVMVMAMSAMGCSDDGVYTPVETNNPPAEQACESKDGCPDAGELDADIVVDAAK